jgi:hypothetical protein
MKYEELERSYYERFSEMSITQEGVRYLKVRTLIDIETLKASEFLKKNLILKEEK